MYVTAANCYCFCNKLNCRVVLSLQQCATGVLDSPACEIPQPDHPRVLAVNMQITAANTTANYICREHVEGNRFYRNISFQGVLKVRGIF